MGRQGKNAWRLGAIISGVAAVIALSAAPASAHVTVNPKEATQGGYGKFTFRVPNEKDAAATTKLEVVIPTQAPIKSVSVKPVPGWTASFETTKLADSDVVSKITWTADTADFAIKPGQFQEFDVSAGPLPAVDQLVFKALQTYSDGDIVRWIDEPKEGATLQHPAPVLKLLPKPAASAAPAVNAAQTTNTGTPSGGNGLALGLSLTALVIALAALGFALRKRSAPAA